MRTFDVKIGATFQYSVTFTDDAGGVLDLTGYTYDSVIKWASSNVDDETIPYDATNSDLVAGVLVFTASATTTAGWFSQSGAIDVRLEAPSGYVTFSETDKINVSARAT